MTDARVDEALVADPAGLIALGCAMMASGKGDKAVALVAQVLAEHPDDPLLRRAAEAILTHKLPGFHREMLADEARGRAYWRAIERAGVEGKTVLDIGAGSGLLAMLAARAGAARVYACEANEALAATAEAIVAANGFGGRVRILPCHSSALDRDRDLGGGVDLIVSEIFSHDLVGEGALPALAHAMAELAAPDARILPARASIRVALAEFSGRQSRRIGTVQGVDLSLFGRHVPRALNLVTNHPRLALRSAPQDLFAFDFQRSRGFPAARASVRLGATDGRANGIAQWLRLQLDDEISYENVPGAGERSHWPAVFHPFDADLAPEPGGAIEVHGWHDERRLLIWADGV